MTNKEQESINKLYDLMSKIHSENEMFREEVSERVKIAEKKIEQKKLPLNLENEVVHAATDVIHESLRKVLLDDYNSPLKKYAVNIITKYQNSIENVFDKIVSEGINTLEFELACKDALLKKIAKTVISGIDGSVDKVVHQMKQDTVFRSKLTLMVNNLIHEYLNQ